MPFLIFCLEVTYEERTLSTPLPSSSALACKLKVGDGLPFMGISDSLSPGHKKCQILLD